MAKDNVPEGISGKLGQRLWQLKVRLQFTGWLQFAPNALAAALLLGLALLAALIGRGPALLVWVPLALGGALLLNLAFDVCTLKLGLRPAEPHPPRLEQLDAFELMRARRSCRSFQLRSLTPEDRAELQEQVERHTDAAALLGSRAIRLEYIEAQLRVWPTLNAREFFVAIAPRDYDRLAVIDVGRSLQKIVTHATRMGVATCWIGPGADHESIIRALGERFDPERDHIICVCALGYGSRFLPLAIRGLHRIQHQRLPLSELFFAGPGLDEPLATEAEPFARFGRCYEVCQWAPSSFNAQPTRCAAVLDDDGELRSFDFYAATASRYYAPVALGIWAANWETGCAALGIAGYFEVLAPSGEPPRFDLRWALD